jgi:hypothetical protein
LCWSVGSRRCVGSSTRKRGYTCWTCKVAKRVALKVALKVAQSPDNRGEASC